MRAIFSPKGCTVPVEIPLPGGLQDDRIPEWKEVDEKAKKDFGDGELFVPYTELKKALAARTVEASRAFNPEKQYHLEK